MAAGLSFTAVGLWLLAFSSWLLAFSSWLLGFFFMAAGSFSQWLWFKRFQDLSQILDLSPDGNGQAREQPRGR